jgi:drug/metabolite transporter (DMT)-like permease
MEKRGLIFIFLTAIISGVSVFLNKIGVADSNPFVFTGLKNVIVAILLLSVIFYTQEITLIKRLTKAQWLKLGIIGLIGGSIPFLLFFKGLQLTTAVQGAFIHKTMFIYIALLSMFFLKEKLPKGVIIGALLLLIGNAMLLKLSLTPLGIGDLLILSATILWSVEIIISKKVLSELPSNIVAWGRMFFGSIFILVFLAATNQLTVVQSLTVTQIFWVLVTSSFLFLYVFTFYFGLSYTNPTTAASILLIAQPITVLLSYLFLHAGISPAQIIGIFFMIVGVAAAIGMSKLNLQKWMHLN